MWLSRCDHAFNESAVLQPRCQQTPFISTRYLPEKLHVEFSFPHAMICWSIPHRTKLKIKSQSHRAMPKLPATEQFPMRRQEFAAPWRMDLKQGVGEGMGGWAGVGRGGGSMPGIMDVPKIFN